MRKRIATKIESTRGASLSMALFLFLACTLAASVAIAAGSAAAGRLAQLKESERSYYNVTSAADLFWKELSNTKSVRITCGCDATYNSKDNEYEPADEPNYSLDVDGTTISLNTSTALNSMLQNTALDLMFNDGVVTVGSDSLSSPTATVSSTAMGSYLFGDSDSEAREPLGLDNTRTYAAFTVTPNDFDAEDVNVKVTRETDGSLTFCFYEDDDQSFKVSIHTTVDIGGGEEEFRPKRQEDGTYRLEYVQAITWDPLSLERGGDAS